MWFMSVVTDQQFSIPKQDERTELRRSFQEVRDRTMSLCETLEIEDYVPQSMPDASPLKWHLAHTTWFLETFVVARLHGSKPISSEYAYLFNSYYNALGERIARDQRGLMTRPTVAEVERYRGLVDEQIINAIEDVDDVLFNQLQTLITLGLHHEQQHQELILTDLKHLFSLNPSRPVYREARLAARSSVTPPAWIEYSGGVREIGHADASRFAFDNESPRHRVFVEPYRLADRLATNAEYLAFVEAGGYEHPEFWLSEGWGLVRSKGWKAPLYWMRDGESGRWQNWTLGGLRDLDLNDPVCHISYFEADAFARWSEARLPTEAEWELAALGLPIEGNLLESETFHPVAAAPRVNQVPRQMFGDVWEWTQSPYTPYPGFRPSAGALGEYNGKFMCNQYVLRGGSCVTPRSHIRATYRNFFPASAQWQFSGVRLARDVSA